jgi:hypothetical protein
MNGLWRIVQSIKIYIRYTCLSNYDGSEALNLCRWHVEKSTKCPGKNVPVILENKISCSLTIVCASSFRPSLDIYCCKTIKMVTHSRKCSQIMNSYGILMVALADTCEYPTSTKLPAYK